jgi:hypothetical protein
MDDNNINERKIKADNILEIKSCSGLIGRTLKISICVFAKNKF